MENTNTEQVKQRKSDTRHFDEDDEWWVAKKGFMIPSNDDRERANAVKWSGIKLSYEEERACHVIVAGWIYDFPIHPDIFEDLERAHSRMLKDTKDEFKEEAES